MGSPAEKRAKPKDQASGTVNYRVYWSEDEDLDTVFVDNLFLQAVNEQVYLTFGQLQVPIGMDPEETAAVEIRPMARMVVSPAALKKIVKMLKTSLDDMEKTEAQ